MKGVSKWLFVVVVVVAACFAARVVAGVSALCASAFGCRLLCSRPYREGVQEYGCGQCLPCRINRRRVWTSRLVLESYLHKFSWFVTLTYAPEHLPKDGSVSPRALQLFMKRLREKCSPEKVRFYGVGEYGDRSGRPHYHLVLYGLRDPQLCGLAWPFGLVHVGSVTHQSAAYVVQYTCKGMTKHEDSRLEGRHPEFARMSRRPGIGADAVSVIAAALKTGGGRAAVEQLGDVPGAIRAAGRMWPLGRYLLNRLRAANGIPAGTGRLAGLARAWLLQSTLRQPGKRDLREQARMQAARIAHVRHTINQSKGVKL